VGNLGGNFSSDRGSHSNLTEDDVGSDPFVEFDGLDSKSLLGLSLGNTSNSNSSVDGGVGLEESLLDFEVSGVCSLVGGLGSAESGMSDNSSLDGNSEVLLSNGLGADGDAKSELGSLHGSLGFAGNLLGLLHEVTDVISVIAGVFGNLGHFLGLDNTL